MMKLVELATLVMVLFASFIAFVNSRMLFKWTKGGIEAVLKALDERHQDNIKEMQEMREAIQRLEEKR